MVISIPTPISIVNNYLDFPVTPAKLFMCRTGMIENGMNLKNKKVTGNGMYFLKSLQIQGGLSEKQKQSIQFKLWQFWRKLKSWNCSNFFKKV